jgi:O-antigen/teichoic acid export membrane protein
MGLDSVGIYGVSMQVSNLLSVVLNPINFVLFPRVAESWNRKSNKEVNLYFSQAVTLTLIASAPIIAGLFVVSDALVPLLAGQGYATNRGIIGFLLLSGLAGMIYQNHLYVINLMEKTYLLPLLFVITAVFNYTFCYFFILKFGIVGAAFARFLTLSIMAFIVTYWARKYIKFILPWDKIFKVAMISLIMGISIFWMPTNNWFQLSVVVITGILEYFVLLFMFKILTFEKLVTLKDIF